MQFMISESSLASYNLVVIERSRAWG